MGEDRPTHADLRHEIRELKVSNETQHAEIFSKLADLRAFRFALKWLATGAATVLGVVLFLVEYFRPLILGLIAG